MPKLDSKYSAVFIDDGLAHEAAKDRYFRRREWVLDRLEYPMVVIGPSTGPSQRFGWAHLSRFIFQDPYLLYLTGVNQPQTALLLDPKSRRVVLFLPIKNPKLEFWEGCQLGSGNPEAASEASAVTGIGEIADIKDIGQIVANSVDRNLGFIWNDKLGKPLSDSSWECIRPLRSGILRRKPGIRIINQSELMWDQRLIMDEVDIKNIRTANLKSATAYRTLLSAWPHLKTEQDAWAVLDGAILKESMFGASFPSIVAGGSNAAVLHYGKNNDPLPPNGLLLTDFGVRWYAMHADITRVAPVSGRYSPLQRLLIEIVLDAQAAVVSAAKPGVSIKDLNKIAWKTVNQGLKTQIIAKGGSVRLPYEDAPHNVSHLLGHQVHDGDPSREYRSRPLKSQMIISNEPGVYGEFEITLGGVHYRESLGIRIEDDLLITDTGCENLSLDCPKTPDEIESILGAKSA
ncbi:M24 family metallopeptidase [bacterium]|nr:M24 family metallopeptidase [bacterium]